MRKPNPLEDDADDAGQVEHTADEIVNEIPEPQQHAIDQATEEIQAESPAAAALELDALGIPWDPAKHSTGPDGKGIKTKSGAWRKRRGLKGSASYLNTSAAGPVPPPEDTAQATEQKTLEAQSRLAGAMVGTLMIRISVGVGGPDFLPRVYKVAGGVEINEESMLQTAWGDYFVAKGVVDVPPGIALVGALAMYYLPRLQAPAVKEKAGGALHWAKERIVDFVFWVRKRKRKPKVDPKSTPTFDNLSADAREYGASDVPHRANSE